MADHIVTIRQYKNREKTTTCDLYVFYTTAHFTKTTQSDIIQQQYLYYLIKTIQLAPQTITVSTYEKNITSGYHSTHLFI